MCRPTQVQEGQFAVRFRFDGKLDVVVNAVDVPGESFHFVLMDWTPKTKLPWRTNVEQYLISPVITTRTIRTSGSPSGPSGSGSKNT